MIDQISKESRIDAEDCAVQLGHVLVHQNSNWNSSDLEAKIPDEEHELYSKVPDDLDPVG